MNPSIEIRMAQPGDTAIVGELAYKMECELWPEESDTLRKPDFLKAADLLLRPDTGLWAFIASGDSGIPVGVLTLNKCAAIYAGGYFGEIADLYVEPSWRSGGVGRVLVDAAVAFGRKKGWSFLEVGAPGLPRWQRTFNFYNRIGFREIGLRLELSL